ncbi:aminopeptidase N [Arsenicicoccus sp. oral taxon 190]|uniref:aminopeptidase N n=1 Tax=Arsenicicoccus sp. oral taxon 190 TaxID=1658671 RepID=UPI00067A2C22|nr:aminopeptidase N [Arsenicicoccus sp. oral taxon 190]AKT51242.1 aminopeptidase [Arsenicicoccus sp. oral taxon 190]
MTSLTRTEARMRAATVTDPRYAVELDLTGGERTFASRTVLTFAGTEGGETFVDLKATELHEATLNGAPLPHDAWADGRLHLTGLAADNELVVRATMTFSKDGSGLHRAVDPADGEHYVYGHSFMDAAPRVFACFDQPDLKAPYTFTVTAPSDWVVIGNGASTRDGDVWHLAETAPIATYFVSICAGPYAAVTDEHDGIPLGLFARRSIREELEANAPQILAVTRASFDYFHELFGIRYAFGKYDQVWVPEFNAGAMENPGCVVLRDEYLFRSAVTRGQLLGRDNTVSHEMAHMWFGDLVTLAWWDDLWLNESFAEYMASRCVVGTGLYPDAWADQGIVRKAWGYAAERSPSTHPVAGNGSEDALAALQNFDGISYAKGSAVLRQLIAYIGDEAFVAGVRDYLTRHAHGNAEMGDFFAAMERAYGAPLTDWTDAWLRTAGLDQIRVDLDCADESSQVVRAEIVRVAPEDHPADRSHRLDVAGWTDGEEVVRTELTVDAERSVVPALLDRPRPAVVVPNASDLTWATVVLDEDTLRRLPEQLPQLDDLAARVVVWNALRDGLALATVDPRLAVDVFCAAWPLERDDSVLGAVGGWITGTVVGVYLPEEERREARERVAAAAATALAEAEPGSTQALAAARVVASASTDVALLRRWYSGAELPAGLEGDDDFRWLVATTLAGDDELSVAELDEAREADRTVTGTLAWLGARAARPTAQDKAWAWAEFTEQLGRSNHEMNALAGRFWTTGSTEVLRPYVDRYFADVPAMCAWVGDDAMARVARLAYPVHLAEPATLQASQEAQQRSDLTAAVRRGIVDQETILRQVLASRQTYRG